MFLPVYLQSTDFEAESLRSLLTKSLEQFGDKFYIKHVPTRCQEGISVRFLPVLFTIDNF